MIEEKSLENLLEKDKQTYSLEESAEIMKKILYALDDLHRKGRLHLDLCPENILLFPEYVLLLYRREEWRKTKMVWAYTAPEVWLKNLSEIGPPSDVYSACAIFFRLLTGRKMTEEEVIGMGMHWSVFADLEVFAEVPKEVFLRTVQILRKGLHILPRKRYSCADELLREIEELCEAGRVIK